MFIVIHFLVVVVVLLLIGYHASEECAILLVRWCYSLFVDNWSNGGFWHRRRWDIVNNRLCWLIMDLDLIIILWVHVDVSRLPYLELLSIP
jgi:hypothetical protein